MSFDLSWGSAAPGALAVVNTMTDVLNITPSDLVFPIGSIYTTIDGTNPASTLGYGTWTAFGAGKVLVGITPGGDPDFDTVEETGGSKTVSAIVANHDSHTHSVDVENTTSSAPSDTVTVDNVGSGSTVSVASSTHTHDVDPASVTSGNESATQTHTITASSVVQPYIVVYMWKRTA